ncbi:MAG: hypothetical protein M3N38_01885 [Pseudomonadota bacterium]|nr:hypothetical protein [Pseudomonadota bacterium]
MILRASPPIIFSSALHDYPLGFISYAPEMFLDRPSLHLVSPSWSLLSKTDRITTEYKRIRAEAPKAHVVTLASDGTEVHELSSAGIPAIACNHTMLTNERVFRPRASGNRMLADAVYNARFAPWKRHHLCRKIDSLALIYFHIGGVADIEHEVRNVLVQARYLNHEAGGGRFKWLSGEEVAGYISRCRVGLALSETEGAMRACMEYLFCGVPVISTPAEGGRLRYLLEPFAKVVEPDEDAIRAAVNHFVKAQLNPLAIRKAVANIVAFERHEFAETLNALQRKIFGRESSFVAIDALIGNALTYRPAKGIAAELDAARAYGQSLP